MSAPANDNFANAIALTSGALATGTNLSATTETGEPGHNKYCTGPVYPTAQGSDGPHATVWYSWTAPATDYYFFTTSGFKSGYGYTNFASAIMVFTANNPSSPAVNALTAVTPVMDHSAGDGGGLNNGATIAWKTTSGTTYYIQVDGRNNSLGLPIQGNFVLTWGLFEASRFGGCGSTNGNFNVLAECFGSIQIGDVTKDSVNNFGTYSLAAGKWKVVYVGGAFEVYTYNAGGGGFATYPLAITATNWMAYCGTVYNAPGTAVIWDFKTSYSAGQVVLGTDNLVDTSPTAFQYGHSIFTAQTTTSPLYPTGPGWTFFNNDTNNFAFTPDANLGGSFIAWLGDPGANSTETYNYTATYPSYTAGASGPYAPWNTSYSDWSQSGTTLTPLTQYGSAATAIAANACVQTAYFNNVAGVIGVGFETHRQVHYTDASDNIWSRVSTYANNGGGNNPTAELLYFPFLISMLEISGLSLGGSGTSWSITPDITNLTAMDWDNCTVALLNTGGISGASAPLTAFDIPASGTAGATFTFTATPGFVTATLQVSRNGVVVGTLSCPLYPVITLQLQHVAEFERTCTGYKVWYNEVSTQTLWPPGGVGIFPSAWGNTFTFNFTITTGQTWTLDTNPCGSPILCHSFITSFSGCGGSFGSDYQFQPDIVATSVAQTVGLQCTFMWGSTSLPAYTGTIVIPPA